MSVTTFEGVVRNGQVQLPAGVALPERTRVYVVVPEAGSDRGRQQPSRPFHQPAPRLANTADAGEFTLEVEVTGAFVR